LPYLGPGIIIPGPSWSNIARRVVHYVALGLVASIPASERLHAPGVGSSYPHDRLNSYRKAKGN